MKKSTQEPGSTILVEFGIYDEPQYCSTSALTGLAGREYWGRTPDAARARRDDAERVYLAHLEKNGEE